MKDMRMIRQLRIVRRTILAIIHGMLQAATTTELRSRTTQDMVLQQNLSQAPQTVFGLAEIEQIIHSWQW